ncbi:4-vinyl reductase, partial [Alicyclobacillus suci]|uniref:4-vinyl reductase n=1 Tax=Alicyclobacillus suci TaxID=2816080 RepID=UPI001A8D4E95
CWTLAGYASGYLSTIMGQPVVTVEPTCRGRGDATCTYHATTVVHANEADLSDFHYYEAVNLSEELDRAHALLEERNRGLSRAHELQS